MAFEQVAVDQRIAVVERQRQPAAGLGQLMQHRQDRVGFGQPFQHGVADHQIVRFGELTEQFLPRRLNECRGLPGFGETLAGAFEHRLGRLGEGHVMPAFGQPQRHVAEAATDVEHPQRTIRQRFGEVGLQHREANRAFGAAVDFFGEPRRQLIEMPVAHQLNRRSLSASLARTTSFMSSPNSLHSSNRYRTISPTSCPAWASLSAGNWRDWSSRQPLEDLHQFGHLDAGGHGEVFRAVKLPPVIAVANGVQAFGQFNKVHRALLKAYSFGGIRPEGKRRAALLVGAGFRQTLYSCRELGHLRCGPRLSSFIRMHTCR